MKWDQIGQAGHGISTALPIYMYISDDETKQQAIRHEH